MHGQPHIRFKNAVQAKSNTRVRVHIVCISELLLQLNLLCVPHKRPIKESSNYQDITPQRHHARMPTDPTQTIRHTKIQDKFRSQYLTSSCKICAYSPLTNAQPTQSSGHASREASQCTQQLQPLPLVEPPELWQPQLSPFCSPLKLKLQVTCKIHTCMPGYAQPTESNSPKQCFHR